MANDAAIAELEEINKELDMVKEELLKKGPNAESKDEAFVKAVQSARAFTESIQERSHEFPVKRARCTSPKSGQTSAEASTSVSDVWMIEMKKAQLSLLSSLPSSSAYEDSITMKTLLVQAAQYPEVLPLFAYAGAINQVLNPTSINRSFTDDALQCLMAGLVLEISSLQDNVRKILHICPDTMPFLIACLRSKTPQTRSSAARSLSWLTSVDSNSKIVVESGAIKPLLELIQEKDPMGLPYVATAIFYICKVAENRERAVFEGVVIVVMDNIKSGDLVYHMLEILEALSSNEKAILQMEENGMVECLFGILRKEGVETKEKEFSVSIIHRMCNGDLVKTKKLMDEVENARDTLERVVGSGIEKAVEKASEILGWIQLLD